MSKLKVPCLSLGARGSVGEAVTFTERLGQNIVEKKPELPYFLTLPVQYQRWLYQDYAYLWTQQSEATKRQYAAAGVRFHLTGFQYWMKFQLTNLPDIVGWWKLDEGGGAVAYDSSRNGLNGAIIGASPATGVIDGCLGFDGLNDLVTLPLNSLFDLRSQMTMMCTIRLRTAAAVGKAPGILDKPNAYSLRISPNSTDAYNRFRVAGLTYFTALYTLTIDADTHLATTFDSTLATNELKFFVEGSLFHQINAPGQIDVTANPFQIGRVDLTMYIDALIDNAILFNRALDPTEIARWSARRWP